MNLKEIEEDFKEDRYCTKSNPFVRERIDWLIQRLKELEHLLCIAHDFLRPKYEMDSEPLHQIDVVVKEILRKDLIGGDMSNLLKVTLEFDDKILTIDGEEVKKWDKHNASLATLAFVHGMNPFDTDPIKWNIKVKQ